jgi:hypothetical protein
MDKLEILGVMENIAHALRVLVLQEVFMAKGNLPEVVEQEDLMLAD